MGYTITDYPEDKTIQEHFSEPRFLGQAIEVVVSEEHNGVLYQALRYTNEAAKKTHQEEGGSVVIASVVLHSTTPGRNRKRLRYRFIDEREGPTAPLPSASFMAALSNLKPEFAHDGCFAHQWRKQMMRSGRRAEPLSAGARA